MHWIPSRAILKIKNADCVKNSRSIFLPKICSCGDEDRGVERQIVPFVKGLDVHFKRRCRFSKSRSTESRTFKDSEDEIGQSCCRGKSRSPESRTFKGRDSGRRYCGARSLRIKSSHRHISTGVEKLKSYSIGEAATAKGVNRETVSFAVRGK